MKTIPTAPALATRLLRPPARKRLAPPPTQPGVSRIWVSPGPLRRLAWIFGFGPGA